MCNKATNDQVLPWQFCSCIGLSPQDNIRQCAGRSVLKLQLYETEPIIGKINEHCPLRENSHNAFSSIIQDVYLSTQLIEKLGLKQPSS